MSVPAAGAPDQQMGASASAPMAGAISTLMVPVASLPCRDAVASTAYGRARQAALIWVLSESGSTGWCVSLC